MKTLKTFTSKYLYWLVMILWLPLVLGCQKDEIKTPEDAYKVIVGEWEWVSSTTATRLNPSSPIITPQTEEKTVRLVFTNDKTLSLFVDGLKTDEYSYKIDKRHQGDHPFHIEINGISNHTYVSRQIMFEDANKRLVLVSLSPAGSSKFRRL